MPEYPAHNKSKFLSKRNIHTYLNWFPADVPPGWKSPFYDLYHDFSVNEEAVPFVLIHIQTDQSNNSSNSYNQKLTLDMRQIYINDSVWNKEIEALLREKAGLFF